MSEQDELKALRIIAAAARLFLSHSDDMNAYQNLKAALAQL